MKKTNGKVTNRKHEKTPQKVVEAEKQTNAAPAANIEARSGKDRRADDRRQQNIPVPVERRQMERRVKVNRRRQIDPTTCERDYSPDELEFMSALDDYKRRNGRMFPTCSEVLEVLKSLGYEKCPVMPASSLPLVEPVAEVPVMVPLA